MNENKAIEANAPAIAPEEKVIAPTDDAEAKIAALEAEKATLITLIENEANYKLAYLKEKKKNTIFDPNETEEDKIRRITREELAESALNRIDTEKENLLKKLAKENKELKFAYANKTDIPASTSSHSEGVPVRDTLITPDQLNAFKAKGWTDKDIERYKKNLVKFGGR